MQYNMGMENKLRSLPSVDKLLAESQIKDLEKIFPHELIVSLIRENLEFARAAIGREGPAPSIPDITLNICHQAEALSRPALRPLINATGVVLHTNLGRAPLSEEAILAM